MENKEVKMTVEDLLWKRWLNVKEASKYIGVSENTFRNNFVKTGLVVPVLFPGCRRFDRHKIDELFESRLIS